MIKTDLSLYDNSEFRPGGSPTTRLLWYFCSQLFFVHGLFPFSFIKVVLLRLFGAKIGMKVTIKPSVNIKYPWNLNVGDHVWIGEHVWIDNLASVHIASNSCISQGAMLLTGNHNYRSKSFDLITKGIRLEEGVWIGAKSTVCPGVTCQTHSVLSVGSVATGDLTSYSIYQGNPAAKIKAREMQ